MLLFTKGTTYQAFLSQLFLVSREKCCQVPNTISGTYLIDYDGNWNTEAKFVSNHNIYGVTVLGLNYDNKSWTEVATNISVQLSALAKRASTRDLSWNFIAWASFTAINKDRGYLQFFASGEASTIFNQPVVAFGFASAKSKTKICELKDSTSSYSKTTKLLTIESNLGCLEPPCVNNPCPDILSPQAMGYDTTSATTGRFSIDIDVSSLSTALAVNLGIIKIKNLVPIDDNSDLVSLLLNMYKKKHIDNDILKSTKAYYGK